MMQTRNRKICLLAIVGALLFVSNCKSHQMNISNTWTLPQDGFTVFYRFFRDKISWYEADAVCQFHHANLVTVDNGVKYDASRAYLSDLNVTENIWIGLMRSQNSDRFMWSNSKILDREFGYWAEQIPAIDSPMCAVVDPLKDYRWHSLRCGGPDVASFLCEMEAPDWATDCLIRALPSLTIQYIADSATIELSRDCGSEGIKRLTCNGKQDQDLIQRELMCMSERESITNDNEMKAASAAIETPSDVIGDDDVTAAQSDNLENNNIDKMANQIEASADKINDKFNLDETMMGDAPIASQEADDVKPVKNTKKFASDKPLKTQPKQLRKAKKEQMDDMMMGDQPIEEILPHVKKTINEKIKEPIEITATPKSLTEIMQTTIEVRNRRETEMPIKTSIATPTTETSITNESNTIQLKASHKEITHDHFIPPMLLVQHQNSTQAPATDADTTTLAANVSTSESIQQSSTQQVPTTTNLSDLTTISSTIETSSTVLMTSTPISTAVQEVTTVSSTSTSTHGASIHEHTKPHMMSRPHAPKFGGEISYHAPITVKPPVENVQGNETIPVTPSANSSENANIAENITSSYDSGSTTIKPTESTTEITQAVNGTVTSEASASVTAAPVTTDGTFVEVAKRSNYAVDTDKHQQKHQHKQDPSKTEMHLPTDDEHAKHADFTNSDPDFKQYKPNRKRILTKPETHTYIQKIFG